MPKKKSKVEEDVELNMTPMIDVTFQLLIFFIVTMKFRLLEKKLNSYLPTDFGLNTTPQIVDEIFMTVKLKQRKKSHPGKTLIEQETEYFVESEKINGTVAEIHQKIFNKIDSFRKRQKDAKGKIEAGTGVPHKHVVSALDLFHKAEYETITFVGLASNKSVVTGNNWWQKIRKQLAQVQ